MKFKIVLLLLILALFVSGCEQEQEQAQTEQEVISLSDPYGEDWTLQMTLENVTPTGAKAVFTHSGEGAMLTTGEMYIIEKLVDGEWIALEPINDFAWTLLAYHIPNNDSRSFDTDWEYAYGALPTGKYRLGKSVRIESVRTNEYQGNKRIEHYSEDKVFYAEFEIE